MKIKKIILLSLLCVSCAQINSTILDECFAWCNDNKARCQAGCKKEAGCDIWDCDAPYARCYENCDLGALRESTGNID